MVGPKCPRQTGLFISEVVSIHLYVAGTVHISVVSSVQSELLRVSNVKGVLCIWYVVCPPELGGRLAVCTAVCTAVCQLAVWEKESMCSQGLLRGAAL